MMSLNTSRKRNRASHKNGGKKMNERDYTMIELITLISGAVGISVWGLAIFFYKQTYTIMDMAGVLIAGIIVFFFALVAHFKRSVYLAEMKASLKGENNEVDSDTIQKL